VLCVFAGLRPLAAPKKKSDEMKTKEISRSHKLLAAESGLITITGGKWTTYRIMAEETIDLGIKTNNLPFKPCITRTLKIHGYMENPDMNNHLYVYGSDQDEILKLQKENPEYAEKLNGKLDFTVAEVVWAVREEMARTIDDVLARRVRALYMDARASIEMAPKVAEILAKELGKNKSWEKEQVREYTEMAKGYFLS
jgi:glycerol-3-phosphate dehydrogenase